MRKTTHFYERWNDEFFFIYAFAFPGHVSYDILVNRVAKLAPDLMVEE